jgi:ABC-type lipoprotein release transport system permease subunit
VTGLIWRIALRNVLAHRAKSIIVGIIFAVGALVVVVGNALVDAMDVGMARSIQESLAGHLQVHSKDARDPLAIYGDEFAGMPDFGVMADFAAVQATIAAVPGVTAIIPMGSQIAFSGGGNLLDRRLSALRVALREGDAVQAADLRAHIKRIVVLLAQDIQGDPALGDAAIRERIAAARIAASPDFWTDFDTQTDAKLEFLENKVAPLMAQSGFLPVWFLGTDLTQFAKHFDRFKIVKGRAVPLNTRGFLFNDGVYEEQVKHRVAWAFDKLTKAAGINQRIADDATLQSHVDTMKSQAKAILFQLTPAASAQVEQALRAHLKTDAPLDALLDTFLAVDDATLAARNALFYKAIVPHIELYQLRVGDTITLRSFTRSGYARAVNLTIYGTFAFEGLENSTITSQHNLVDMISFRDLFGHATPESKAEIDAMRAEAKVEDITRGDAEDAMFGAGDALVEDDAGQAAVRKAAVIDIQRTMSTRFTAEDVTNGMALHAAVLLEPGTPEQVESAKIAVQAALDAAGLKVNVLTWQEASGIVGQIVLMIRLVLLVVVSLLSIVALVIINNSMVMATMDRVKEIGTMRAIGAQKTFINQLFVTETLVLALISGVIGSTLGAALVWWMQSAGVPATNEFMTFLFAGPALRPELTWLHVGMGVFNVVLVGMISTAYPAKIAARITPVQAMRSRA